MNMEHIWKVTWSHEDDQPHSDVFWSELEAWTVFNKLVTNFDLVDLDKLVPSDNGTGRFDTVKVYSFDRAKAFTDWGM